MKKFSNIITIVALLAIIALITGISYGYYLNATMEVENPIVTMTIKDYGTIKLELYPEMAPETVANFVTLAQNKFYDGLKIHRVVKDFMIQGGDINGDGSGGPKLSNIGITDEEDREYCIEGEFLSNKYTGNKLKHKEGTISMARADYTEQYDPSLTTESYNSAGSQFFIVTKDSQSLDGNYAAFGKVIEGMDIVHKIEAVEVKAAEEEEESTDAESTEPKEEPVKETPVTDVIIESITVETFGADYSKFEKLEVWDYYDWIYETYGINLRPSEE